MANVVKSDLPKTRAALDEFYAGEDKRREDWEVIETVQDFESCTQADYRALRKVQEAFYEDTKAFNLLENCHRLPLDYLIKVSGWKLPE